MNVSSNDSFVRLSLACLLHYYFKFKYFYCRLSILQTRDAQASAPRSNCCLILRKWLKKDKSARARILKTSRHFLFYVCTARCAKRDATPKKAEHWFNFDLLREATGKIAATAPKFVAFVALSSFFERSFRSLFVSYSRSSRRFSVEACFARVFFAACLAFKLNSSDKSSQTCNALRAFNKFRFDVYSNRFRLDFFLSPARFLQCSSLTLLNATRRRRAHCYATATQSKRLRLLLTGSARFSR